MLLTPVAAPERLCCVGDPQVLGTVAMPNLSKFFNSWVTHVMATAWGPGGQPGSSRDHKPTLVDYADLEVGVGVSGCMCAWA